MEEPYQNTVNVDPKLAKHAFSPRQARHQLDPAGHKQARTMPVKYISSTLCFSPTNESSRRRLPASGTCNVRHNLARTHESSLVMLCLDLFAYLSRQKMPAEDATEVDQCSCPASGSGSTWCTISLAGYLASATAA